MNIPFGYFFGWPAGQVWPNLLASAICALLVWWRLHRQGAAQHAEALAQAAWHHVERTAQAEAHHVSLKAHVTAVGAQAASTAAVAVPQQLLDDIRNAPKRTPGGDPP